MKPYIIEAKTISPEVKFDPENNIYEIKGESRPESVRDFYQPILDWLEEYSVEAQKYSDEEKKDKGIIIHFKLDYFNSSSAKYFLDIIKSLIANFHSNGIDIKIFWYYEEGDEDMQEAGEELSHMVKYPFKYIAEKPEFPYED